MKTCLETIRIENRQWCGIAYHNERFNRTRRALLGIESPIRLEDVIAIPSGLSNNIYKCRLIYDVHIHKIEFHEYSVKPIRSIQLVADNDIDYHYKWLDRSCFAQHLAATSCDDILIVKNGFLTDISYANVAFFDGEKWRTPATPLLAGTRRRQLLEEGKIAEEILQPKDLRHFRSAKLLNAMLAWEESSPLDISVFRL